MHIPITQQNLQAHQKTPRKPLHAPLNARTHTAHYTWHTRTRQPEVQRDKLSLNQMEALHSLRNPVGKSVIWSKGVREKPGQHPENGDVGLPHDASERGVAEA